MAQNIGTLVSATIRPNDEFDPIATAYGNEIKGSLHSYETLDEVYLLIKSRREWGMFANVYNDGDNNGVYQLKYHYYSGDITDNTNWVKTNIDKKGEWVDSVKSILLVEPLLEPFLGDRYLLGTTSSIIPTGSQWSSIDPTVIVEYNNNGTWDITYPTNGMTVRDDSNNNVMYKYLGTFPDGEWKLERITNVFYIEPSSVNGITYSTTTSPKFTSYTNDLIFLTKFFTPNIGSASLSINGLAYKKIKIATTSGLRDLILSDINTTSIYSLSYNGTYFQLTKPFPTDAYNIEFYIAATETMTVGDSEQYWVYGDLTIAGTMVNYGKIIVANGAVILEGSGSLSNQGDGEVILVDLFNTPTFNTTTTIQMSSEMTLTGPSVSSAIVSNSITTDLLNTVGGVTASYILSNDGGGSFKWIAPTVGGTDTNSNLFYNSGGTVSATNSTSAIYRRGSLNIGSGTATSGRFVVSSLGGTISLIVDEYGSVYNRGGGNDDSNTAFGNGALVSNTPNGGNNGTYNVALGTGAMGVNTTGYSNLAIGAYALYYNNGNYNVAIGGSALQSNTSGSQNMAIGGYSLYLNQTGIKNTAIGTSALQNSRDNYNTAIGNFSGYNITYASSNTLVGFQAGSGITTGSNNTIIADTGYAGSGGGITTGNNNLIIAQNNGNTTGITTGSNNTIIGKVSGLATGLSASVILSDGSGNIRFYSDSNGNSGIGTTSPSTKLHIYATQSGAFRLQDGTQASGYILTSDASGVSSWKSPSIYSTASESIVGSWIDGKPIYRKVISGTTSPVDGWWQMLGLQTSLSLKSFVSMNVLALDSGTGNYQTTKSAVSLASSLIVIPSSVASSTPYIGVQSYVSTPSSPISIGFLVILEYTKTTD